MSRTDEFRQAILDSGILDKEGVHHVFSQGLHGRKIDFDLIPDDSELFNQWVEITADFIRDNYEKIPDVLIGVANGTNRLAFAVADKLNVPGLDTVKPEGSRNQPVLTEASEAKLKQLQPGLIVILEDVGTRGTNSSSVARSVRELGFDNLEVINTWQRSETLTLLDELKVPYKAVIKEVLISYKPEECEYCQEGWELLGHGKVK
jgi:orotate phosphoribosyltransferase